MSDMPLVSVILPVYNGERTLSQTISSVLEQTYGHFELIILDDGSKDASQQVAADFVDDRIKLFSFENAGIAENRNRGIVRAAGEYVAFIDQDDLWAPAKLEDGIVALEKNPQAGLVYSWVDYIDENGGSKNYSSHITKNGRVYQALLLGNFMTTASNIILRKKTLEYLGEFDQSLAPNDDWDFLIRLALRFSIICIPKVQLFYRISWFQNSYQKLRTSEITARKILEREFSQNLIGQKQFQRECIATLYRNLIAWSTKGFPPRKNCSAAIRFLVQLIWHDPSSLWRIWRMPWVLRGVLKILLFIWLPEPITRALRNRRGSAVLSQ